MLSLLLALLCLAGSASAAEHPLLQEGKKTLFQRVFSHPGAVLYRDPAGQITAGRPRTFTAYYVYARQKDMLRVGVSSTEAQGWIKASDVTDWPQAITMKFTDQQGRQPVLFFKDYPSLENVCAMESLKGTVEQLVELCKKGRLPKDSPILACEPSDEKGEVAKKNFYLFPVLNIRTDFKDAGTQLLEVACVDAGTPEKKKPSTGQTSTAQPSGKNDGMTTGIVFVVDTTISMRPYIEQTKEIIRHIFDKLQTSPAKDKIAIAVIGFRSNTRVAKDIEYNTRIISDFTKVNERASLERLLDQLEEAKAPTHAFNEDSLAAVKDAVDELAWDTVDAKMILLVTDAGPLTDKTSRTAEPLDDTQSNGPDRKNAPSLRNPRAVGMTPEGMAVYLREKGIYLTAIHVKTQTPSGKRNHAYAEKSYRELSKLSNGRSTYIAIDAPTKEIGEARFKSVGDIVAKTFCNLAEKQLSGGSAKKPQNQDAPANASPEDMARYTAEMIGYGMQLQFVGDKKDTRAPGVQRAWVADADLIYLEEHPQNAPVPAVEPAVLMTKLQLSRLRQQLNTIIQTAEEAFLQDNERFNFYEQLISAAAQMSSDPSQFSSDPKANLVQKGVLPEVLEGLPYKSHILGMQADDWTNMSTGEKTEFITRLKGLVRDYEVFDADQEKWECFGSREANECVFRVPFSRLP